MRAKQLSRTQMGFTLIEIMVVVVILGILSALIVPKIMNRPEQAREVRAKQDVATIENALDLYNLDNGTYPTTEQGLAALATAPTTPPIPTAWHQYLKQVPIDPWGEPYHYANPGQHGQVDVFSYGSTKKPGDKIFGNWNLQ
jgi:general secretion pathway protein G